MKCTVGNQNLGIWCRAIHCLTQIGDNEVFLDFSDDVVTISTVNTALTSFSTFLFSKPFFSSYQMDSPEPEKVTLPSKIVLKPYRTQRVAKSYLKSEITYAADKDFVTVKSEGKSRVVTTYQLAASTNVEEIEMDTDPDSLPNSLRADAKVISNCLSNFTHVKGLAEITLKIQGQKVTLRNSVTDVAKKDGSVVTEYNLSSYDFIDFEVPSNFDMEFMFGFREFKIFTAFAEQLKSPISIHFEESTKPVIFSIRTELLEARLCMSTREKDPFGSGQPNGASQPVSLGSDGRISNVSSASATPSISQEVNRRNNRVTGAEISNQEQQQLRPPAKRLRRTEAPPPAPPLATSLLEPNASIQLHNEVGDPAPAPPVSIGQLVDQMEVRQKSNAYKTIQRLMSAPRMTEEEYLKTIPGHDIVLCPASDEED